MPYAVLFPGQGSQHVGMGADVIASRPDLLVDTADGILGWSLSTLCLEGPEPELTRTDRAQAALYATSYALWEALRGALTADGPTPAAAAGHSLGEYTALAASGAVGFATGLELVARRGEAMATAAARTDSGMAALLGGDLAAAESLVAACRDAGGQLWVANINAPGQVVVAGDTTGLAWATQHAGDHGVRRVVRLKVAGAFHTPLMAPAADELEVALDDVDFATGSFPVWSNADAAPAGDTAEALHRQLTSPVRFEQTLVGMAERGIDVFVHVGPGDVTAGLARRTVPDAAVHVVSGLDDIPGVVEAVQ